MNNWEELQTDDKKVVLNTFSDTELREKFGFEEDFFKNIRIFFDTSQKTKTALTAQDHPPDKQLIKNARRDLQFIEANFELIDNSIDSWIDNGQKQDLIIEINYDLSANLGWFKDNAGGMDEDTIWKIYSPGHSTNFGTNKTSIGSFGMGAKKSIFRLSDGSWVHSSIDGKSATVSEVPEGWENIPGWKTNDGVVPIAETEIEKGETKIYFAKLFQPPTKNEIDELIKTAGFKYNYWINGSSTSKKVSILINGTKVDFNFVPPWSGATGAEPRDYVFSREFQDFQGTGLNFEVELHLRMGLCTTSNPSANKDWGINISGNGRLFADDEKGKSVGWGITGYTKGSGGMYYLRGDINIIGPGTVIPWDDHKRMYINDHIVAQWVRLCIKGITQKYAKIAQGYASNTLLRHQELEGMDFDLTKIKKFVIPKNIVVIDSSYIPSKKVPAQKKKPKPPGGQPPQPPGGQPPQPPGGQPPQPPGGQPPQPPGGQPPQPPGGQPPGGQPPQPPGGVTITDITLSFDEDELDVILDRYGLDQSDISELQVVLKESILEGVNFTLTDDELTAFSKRKNCKINVNDISEIVKNDIIKYLTKN